MVFYSELECKYDTSTFDKFIILLQKMFRVADKSRLLIFHILIYLLLCVTESNISNTKASMTCIQMIFQG